jgi:hypothetical protein
VRASAEKAPIIHHLHPMRRSKAPEISCMEAERFIAKTGRLSLN